MPTNDNKNVTDEEHNAIRLALRDVLTERGSTNKPFWVLVYDGRVIDVGPISFFGSHTEAKNKLGTFILNIWVNRVETRLPKAVKDWFHEDTRRRWAYVQRLMDEDVLKLVNIADLQL